MASILDTLAEDVSAALTGTLHPVTYWQYSVVDDGHGNYEPSYDTSFSCEGIRGSFEAVIAGLSGIPRTDAKIEILASSLPTTPKALDKIYIEGEWWIVTERQLDPSTSWWELQCSATDAVTP